jgi:hypothetical protein
MALQSIVHITKTINTLRATSTMGILMRKAVEMFSYDTSRVLYSMHNV